MSRDKTFQRTQRIAAILSLVGMMAAWLSACARFSVPTATPFPICTLDPSANIYNPTQTPSALTPALPFPTPVNTPPIQPLLTAKQSALRELMDHVERWTNIITIPVGETSSARIAITLLSPELVWTVSVIDKMDASLNNPYMYMEAAEHLQKIAASNSFLFFMTIFPVGSGGADGISHTIQIDAGQLTLVNARGLAIKPVSYDHNLNYRFPSSQTTYGYLYFPISVDTESGCKPVLDGTFDTKLVFQLSEVLIDETPTGPYSWMIQYTYLLNSENIHHDRAGWMPPPDGDILANNFPPTSAEINDDFWKEYAEFIWGKTTP